MSPYYEINVNKTYFSVQISSVQLPFKGFFSASLCEDFRKLTMLTSSHIPDRHLTISVVYETFSKINFYP